MKRYGFLYLKLRMLIVEIHILQIEFLCFEDTILSLSDSIVRRIVPFGHTDLNMMFPQQVYICVASVLGAGQNDVSFRRDYLLRPFVWPSLRL